MVRMLFSSIQSNHRVRILGCFNRVTDAKSVSVGCLKMVELFEGRDTLLL